MGPTNLLPILPVKEFWKAVNNWRSFEQVYT